MLRLNLDILSGSFELQFTATRMICTNLILLENLTSLRFSMGGKSAQLPASEIMDVVAAFLKLQYAPCIFNSCGLGLPKSWHQC